MRKAMAGMTLIATLAGGAENCEDYWSRGNPSQAAACFEKAALEQPGDAYLHYRLGLVYRELGDNRRAAGNLQIALDHGFTNLSAQVNLVEAAFASGQSALALRTAVKAITPELRSQDVLMRLGRLLFDHLFYKAALRAFELAHQAQPEAFEPRVRLALTHFLLKEYAQTIALLKSGPDVESNPEVASLDASAEAQLGHTEAATVLLRRVMERFPLSPHAYVNLALIELEQGDAREAESLLAKLPAGDAKVFYAVNRNSCRDFASAPERRDGAQDIGKAEPYYQLAAQLEKRFQYGSALELIRLAQANEGNSARVLYLAGTSCLNLDPQAPEPIEFLQAAVAKDPGFDMAWYMLGRAYVRRGNLEEARRSFEQATHLRADPSYFLSLGRTLSKSGNASNGEDDLAIAAYQRALALDPAYAEAHLELGRLFGQRKDIERAIRELEKAVELEPDFYEADYLLGRLYFGMGETDRAQKYMESFEQKKSALMGQSVIGSGFLFGGQ